MEHKIDALKEDIQEVKLQVTSLDSKVDELVKISIMQEVNLKEHMRRTDLNEERIDIITDELKPIRDHVIKVNFIFKIGIAVGGISAFILTLLQIYNLLK